MKITINFESKLDCTPEDIATFCQKTIGNIIYMVAVENQNADNGITYALQYVSPNTINDEIKSLHMLRGIMLQDAIAYTIDMVGENPYYDLSMQGILGEQKYAPFNPDYFLTMENSFHGKKAAILIDSNKGKSI